MTSRTETGSVLVTGAADGIGFAIAQAFAEQGMPVGLIDVAGDRLARASERIAGSGSVATAVADVRDEAAVTSAIDALIEELGPVRAAVSNAGIFPTQPALEMSTDSWREVVDVNLTGTYVFTRQVARRMIEEGDGGKLCCIASGSATRARMGAAAYCASKAGIVMYAKVLAMELAASRINVNVVSPGFIDHGYREGRGGDFVAPDYAKAFQRQVPWPDAGTARDIADAVLYLCSDQAHFITGAVLAADGGASVGSYSLPMT